MQYRIRHIDQYNWTVESRREEGTILTKGKNRGKASKGTWMIRGYHTTLKHAAFRMIDDVAGDIVLTQQTQDLLKTIWDAQAVVVKVLQGVKADRKTLEAEADDLAVAVDVVGGS